MTHYYSSIVFETLKQLHDSLNERDESIVQYRSFTEFIYHNQIDSLLIQRQFCLNCVSKEHREAIASILFSFTNSSAFIYFDENQPPFSICIKFFLKLLISFCSIDQTEFITETYQKRSTSQAAVDHFKAKMNKLSSVLQLHQGSTNVCELFYDVHHDHPLSSIIVVKSSPPLKPSEPLVLKIPFESTAKDCKRHRHNKLTIQHSTLIKI